VRSAWGRIDSRSPHTLCGHVTRAQSSISVIVPVYNEADEIATIVPAVRDVLVDRGGDWEIIVVDNASEDETPERIRPFLDDRRIHLLRNDRNRGKGYSIRRGMLAASGQLRLMCDADCAPSLVSLPAMEAMVGECEVVAGARNSADSQVARYQPIRRRAASLGFILLCRLVMGEPLRDVFCGFKLFTADAAEDIFNLAEIDGWAFDAEALALARALGYRVRPCGIAWSNRPGSRLSMIHVVLPVMRELVDTRLRMHGRAERALATGAGRAARMARTEGRDASSPPLDGSTHGSSRVPASRAHDASASMSSGDGS
jgi:dolichyl-phosphate beta-glucosyltransferase